MSIIHPRQMRRRLIFNLIASTVLSAGAVSAADSNGSFLVTTPIENCCPPATVLDPCCPGDSYGPTVTPPMMGEPAPMPTESGLVDTNALPATSPEDSASPVDAAPQFDSPITEPTQNIAPAADAFAAAPAATSLASTSGGGGGLDAPNMLGDSPGYGPRIFNSVGPDYSLPGASGRRFKVTENVSPIPQDRVFFAYSHFDDALQSADDTFTYLDRYIFGGEKTFADGLFSVEIRAVITDGFDSDQADPNNLQRGGEFGDLQFAFKSLLYSSCTCQVGGGLTLSVPTADSISAAFNIETDTVYLAPFIGFTKQVGSDSFLQGFLQTDFALGGDDIYEGAVFRGTFNDQNLLYASLSAGH